MPSGEWTAITPTTLPPARQYGAMMYDVVSDDVILFGGLGAGGSLLNDTYNWNGADWAALAPASSPSARYGHAGCSVLNVPYIFGGEIAGDVQENDLYHWDGATWVLDTPLNAVYPVVRKFGAIAQYTLAGGVFLWGGDPRGGDGRPFDNTVWQYDPTVGWISHTPHAPIPPRHKHSAYYDAARGSIIIFGGEHFDTGEPLNDVWEWTGTDFMPIVATDGPSVRAPTQGAAYDPVIMRAVFAPCQRSAGTITTPDAVYLTDGETFTIDDGANPAVVFEFDDDSSVTGGNVAIDITGEVNANVMRARIIAAISASTLNLRVLQGETDGEVQLYALTSDSRNTVAIVEDVSVDTFSVTGMSSIAGDTWTFNGSGAQWLRQEPSVQPSAREGAMLVYDAQAGQNTVMLYGGAVDGTVDQSHYKWVWSSLGVTPYFSLPGTLQERVEPTAVEPTHGNWVMQLGVDRADLPDYYLNIGDEITVQQEISIDSHQLLRFDCRARYSPRLPQFRQITTDAAVDFYAPVKSVEQPTAVSLIPGTFPNTDIEFTLPTALWNTGTEGNPSLQKFTMVHVPTGVRREALGVDASDPAKVRAGDLMDQTDPPSVILSEYAISVGDSGLVRTQANGGDRLIGISTPGAANFENEHADQLIAISGATESANNSSGIPYRISTVPSEVGDVGAFGDTPSVGIPAGRVAIVENTNMVQDIGDSNVSMAVYGAQWRVQCYININDDNGDVLRAELVENLVQDNPNGWQRLHLAIHLSKVSAISIVKFKLKLESVTA